MNVAVLRRPATLILSSVLIPLAVLTVVIPGVLSLSASPAHAQMSFVNVSNSRLVGGISSETWGVSVGDMEGDYWPDIFVGNHRNRPSLYQNDGNGRLVNNILQRDQFSSWLGNRYADKHGAAWSDFDGDGDDDLMSGTNSRTVQTLNVYNRAIGALRDEARRRLRLDADTFFSMWFDIDGDGFSDIVQGRRGAGISQFYRQLPQARAFQQPQQLAGCQGDWAFLSDVNDDRVSDLICAGVNRFPVGAYDLRNGALTDISASLPRRGLVLDAVAADLDNNLKSDLVMVHGLIFSNDAVQYSPRLIEISSKSNGQDESQVTFSGGGELTLNSWGSPATRNSITITDSAEVDGFKVNYNSARDRWTVTRFSSKEAYLQIKSTEDMRDFEFVNSSLFDKPILPDVYMRRPGLWVESREASGLNVPVRCKSIVAADFDNDMDQDLYMACGRNAGNLPNRLFENDGTGRFTQVEDAAGATGATGAPVGDGAGSSESVVTGDFNNDGFIDLFVTSGNMLQPVRARVGPHELLLNNSRRKGNTNSWIELTLVGTDSAADAAGARVVAVAGGVRQLRELGANYHRWSQSDDRVHFGLGSNAQVKLQVSWPSGRIQNFNAVPANRHYRLVEGKGLTRILVRKPVPFAQPEPGDECGEASHFADMDSGVFLYKDCTNGEWKLRATAALEKRYRYSMILSSDGEIVSSRRGSIEDSDFINTSDPSEINFVFDAADGDTDGFDFSLDNGASTCLDAREPLDSNVRVMLGSRHIPVQLPFSLSNLKSCRVAPASRLSVSNLRASESDGTVSVRVSLTPPNRSQTVTATLATERLDATPGEDYFGFSKVITFPPGRSVLRVPIEIIDDTVEESIERIGLRLFDANNALVRDGDGFIVIDDND